MADTTALIRQIEDFYEVWSNGFDGDPKVVAKQLAELCVGSLRTARRALLYPTLLVEAMSRSGAELEMARLSETGLKCRLHHVGKSRLDSFDESLIHNKLTLSGNIGLDDVCVDAGGRQILYFVNDVRHEHHFELDSDDGFILYLACLRFLLSKNKVILNDGGLM